MIQWLTRKAIEWCEREGRVFYIGGKDIKLHPGSVIPLDDADIYMVRHLVVRGAWWFKLITLGRCENLYVHQFLRSDKDCYHDHPWDFWSYIVQGSYTEHQPHPWNDGEWKQPDILTYRSTYSNRIAWRRSTTLHWVEMAGPRAGLLRPYLYSERALSPTTICLTGRRHRPWGFWPKPGTWIFWKDYFGLPRSPGDEMVPSGGSVWLT